MGMFNVVPVQDVGQPGHTLATAFGHFPRNAQEVVRFEVEKRYPGVRRRRRLRNHSPRTVVHQSPDQQKAH